MERKIFLAIVVLALPFFVFGANNTSVLVSADFSVFNTSEICFSSDRVPATGEIPSEKSKSNFQEYDSVSKITEITLEIDLNDPERKAVSQGSNFVTWKIYSNVPADIVLKAEGPLKTQGTTTDYLNWQISMVQDTSKVAGTLDTYAENPNFNYERSEIYVYRSNPNMPGMSGSRAFDITTQSLWGKKESDFSGYIVALVRIQ